MSITRDSFLDKVFWPLALTALTPAATLIGSKLASGDWLAWANRLPSWAYFTFFGGVACWLILGIIVRRLRQIRARNEQLLPRVFTIPMFGYVHVGRITHLDVVWMIRIPAPAPWRGLSENDVHPSQFSIEVPPHCAKCDTELEQTETFFGSYRWSCVRCGYTRKHSASYYAESFRVEKLAKSSWKDRDRH